MSDNTILMTWKRPVPGREQNCNSLFGHTLEYLGGKVSSGQITSFEPILVGANGGGLGGMFLIKGDPAKLSAMTSEDEWLQLITRANVNLEDLGVLRGYSGEAVPKLMGIWQEQLGEL